MKSLASSFAASLTSVAPTLTSSLLSTTSAGDTLTTTTTEETASIQGKVRMSFFHFHALLYDSFIMLVS